MIIMTHSSRNAATCEQAIVRALNSISSKQAGNITAIAKASVWNWDVQVVDDYDGYRSIVIEAMIKNDKRNGFFVAGTAQCLELFETRDDCMALIGTFSDIEALGARLTGLVGRSNAGSDPSALTAENF